nr:NADH dehydrogenase subunit 6 [Elephantomyia inulta]
MMQSIFIVLMTIMSFIFLQMNHPLAMGLMLLIQTFLVCAFTGLMAKTFWFSYVLFLIFLGGMLVLFIYMTSLASNEMFSLSMKLSMISIMLFILFMMIMIFTDFSLINFLSLNQEMMLSLNKSNYTLENSINLNKLYNFPTNILTLLLITYLFLTLIIIVKISNNFYGPLRMKS